MAGNHRWTLRNVQVAFALYYLCEPLGRKPPTHPKVRRSALAIGASPASMSMRLANIASLEKVTGLNNAAKLDQELWAKMQVGREGFLDECAESMKQLGIV